MVFHRVFQVHGHGEGAKGTSAFSCTGENKIQGANHEEVRLFMHLLQRQNYRSRDGEGLAPDAFGEVCQGAG